MLLFATEPFIMLYWRLSMVNNPLKPSPPQKNGHDYMTELETRNRTLQLLNHAGRILTATLEVEQVLERLLQVTTQIIGAEGSSVWLFDEDFPEQLICRAAFHPGNVDSLINQHVKLGQGVAGWVAQSGESAVVNQVQQDGRFYAEIDTKIGFSTVSILAVPLQLRDKIMGVLEVVNKIEGHFLEDDQAIAETLAASASIAIDNAYMVQTMKQQMVDLQSRNEELDAFDHTVAHDLQNPLSLIIGFADILRQRSREEISDEERSRSLSLIVSNAQKMSEIVHELLMLSSVRKSDVVTQHLDMGDVVDAALMRLTHKLEAAEVALILPDIWPQAWGHPAWIEEVWENYLSNAIKYGGSPLHIELGATSLPDGMIRFWVKDNGVGITKENQSQLFTPFTRLNDIRVTGQGLGLSIVRRIVEKLDGQVGIESESGQGSIFSFTLPAVGQTAVSPTLTSNKFDSTSPPFPKNNPEPISLPKQPLG